MSVYFRTLCSIDLHSILSSIPHYFDSCSFILILNLSNVIPPTLVSFFKTFCYSSSFAHPHKFKNQLICIYDICPGTFLCGKGDKKVPGMGWRLLASTEAHAGSEGDGSKKGQGSKTKKTSNWSVLSSCRAVLSPTGKHELSAANVDSCSESRVKSSLETETDRQWHHSLGMRSK